jgi:hypothetical protein
VLTPDPGHPVEFAFFEPTAGAAGLLLIEQPQPGRSDLIGQAAAASGSAVSYPAAREGDAELIVRGAGPVRASACQTTSVPSGSCS